MQNRFCRQKGSHGPEAFLGTAETGDENSTLFLCNRIRYFAKNVRASIAPYTFISHTKMSIFFRKGRSSNYILARQPGKLRLETFSWVNN